jgi:acyl-CoA hydrolase
MQLDRIRFQSYKDKVISAQQAASFFRDKMTIGTSGFTKAGDSKAVLPAFAERAKLENIGITLKAYLSIFVTQSSSKEFNAISHVLPMVSHVDHTEHDVDVLITEQGIADLRGLAPRERAKVIIENCAHPDYKDELSDYFDRACLRGGHTPHILEEAFKFHLRYAATGSMKKSI